MILSSLPKNFPNTATLKLAILIFMPLSGFKMKWFLLLTVAFLAVFFTFSQNVLADSDEFLKFHWKFDEGTGTVVGDSSGNTPSYPGSIYNGPTWIPEGGLSFDGINDYARTTSSIPGSMGVPDQAYTLSASVRIAEGETNGNIIHISNNATGIGWCISMLHLYDGKFRAIGWEAANPVTAVATQSAVPGEWYSIANTWSPEDDELRLYVNGEIVAATPMSSYDAADDDVYVFAGIDSGGCSNNRGWFKGDVKDVRIYSRAITQEEAEDNSEESINSTPSPTPEPTPSPTPTPTPTPSPTPVPEDDDSSSSRSSSSCDSQTPQSTPNLFQISTSPESATLYFSPSSPTTKYKIGYGTTSEANQNEESFDYSDTSGVISYTVKNLEPGTEYFFKVQAKNKCANGQWSNTLAGVTTSNITQSSAEQKSITLPSIASIPRGELVIVDTEQTDSPKPSPSDQSGNGEGYDVEVFVQKEGKPVSGAVVELHSIPRKTTTGADGIARFSNVEGGDHTVYLTYEGYRGEEKITLDSENKQIAINLTIEIKKYNEWFMTAAIIMIIVLLVTVVFLFFILKRRKKKETDEEM